MKGLDWSLPQNNGNVLYGRVTKATAKHVRAQVAMWESDWDTAIEEYITLSILSWEITPCGWLFSFIFPCEGLYKPFWEGK